MSATADPRSIPLETRLDDWINGPDTGLSSANIFYALSGRQRQGNCNELYNSGMCAEYAPLDQDDFGRCFRLLQRVPEWFPRLHELKKVSGTWALVIDHWHDLSALYRKGLENFGPIASTRKQRVISQAALKTLNGLLRRFDTESWE